jgi:hypothetical protein
MNESTTVDQNYDFLLATTTTTEEEEEKYFVAFGDMKSSSAIAQVCHRSTLFAKFRVCFGCREETCSRGMKLCGAAQAMVDGNLFFVYFNTYSEFAIPYQYEQNSNLSRAKHFFGFNCGNFLEKHKILFLN